jgi:peptidyl-prolyl cis-trans isomerase C
MVFTGKINILNRSVMQITIKRLFSEPLIQFLILGVLLFLLTSYIRQYTDMQSREIIVDNERIGMMVMNYKTQTGDLPNKQQLDAMIDHYIREEISYREAKKMGLDKDDEIIRRRLSQKFDFLQTDLTELSQPSEENLNQFYKNNPELFRSEARVSFSHIFFSRDNSSDTIAKQRALVRLGQLKQSTIQRAPEKGDHFPLQYDYTDQAAVDIQQNFGDKPILHALFNAPLHTWIGPVQSGYGWHLVYITKRDSTVQIPFATIKEEVKAQYLEAEKTKQNKKVFDKLSEKYIINRAYLNSK